MSRPDGGEAEPPVQCVLQRKGCRAAVAPPGSQRTCSGAPPRYRQQKQVETEFPWRRVLQTPRRMPPMVFGGGCGAEFAVAANAKKPRTVRPVKRRRLLPARARQKSKKPPP